MRLLMVAALVALFPGCGLIGGSDPAAVVISLAQQALQPYSFHFSGNAQGELGVNSRYAAVDAEVDLVATYRAPVILGGPAVIVWSKAIQRGSGQRAYRVDFGSQETTTGEEQSFVRLVPVAWAEARISMPWLSEPRGDPVPEDDSPPVPIVLPDDA